MKARDNPFTTARVLGIRYTLPDGDWPGLLARLGGDKFVVLLSGVEPRQAEAIVESYHSIFSLPLIVDGRELPLRGSVGLALFPEQGRTFPELLQVADAAMYRVKSASPHRRSGQEKKPRSDSPRTKKRKTEPWLERGRSRRRKRPGWRLATTSRSLDPT